MPGKCCVGSTLFVVVAEQRATKPDSMQRHPDSACPEQVAWVLGNKERALAEHAASVNTSGCGSGMAGQGCAWVNAVDSIQCRVGKVNYKVWPAGSAATAGAIH